MSAITLRIPCVLILSTAFVSVLFTGCVRYVTGVRGETLRHGIGLRSIQIGTTTREQVEERLRPIDTGVSEDRFFLGRWETARGLETPRVETLIIDFDGKGIVQKVSHVSAKNLVRELTARVSRDSVHAFDLSSPVDVRVEYKDSSGKLSLGRKSFAFVQDSLGHRKKLYDFQIASEDLLSLNHAFELTEIPNTFRARIKFKHPTAVGQKMDIRVDFPGMWTLVRYFALVQSQVGAGG